MKIVTVIGNRPQFIKAAAVSGLLRRTHTEILVHTGQHYYERMSDVVFEELGLPEPRFHLGVGSGSHAFETKKSRKASRSSSVVMGWPFRSTWSLSWDAKKSRTRPRDPGCGP